jgi:soluble lytic murein transglycosylase
MDKTAGHIAVFSLILLILMFCSVSVGWGEVYHFVDQDGVLHFTNVPTDPRYKRLMITEGSVTGQPPYLSPKQRSLILRTIEKSAEEFDLEPALIKAVVKAESDFNPMAVSSAGAMGLMQLMPSTASRWSVDDPLDPVKNIWGGVRYLKYLLDLFDGHLPLAIAAYHAGEERVQQHQNIPPIPATQEYVHRVLKYYKKFQGVKPTRTIIYKVSLPTGEMIYTDTPERYLGDRSLSSKTTMVR